MVEVSELLPKKIEDALDEPPICELMKEVSERSIEAFLAIELNKAAALINIDSRLNLQKHQIPTIAQEILSTFNRESLADITICLRRGAMGLYGEIYRVDAAIVIGWIKAYLDEKYQAIENRLMQEKEKLFFTPEEEKHKLERINYWIERCKEATGYVEKKKENVNAYEKMKLTHKPNTRRSEYIKLLYNDGFNELAKYHESKSLTDFVYSFKIENSHIVASTVEEAQEIYLLK